LPTRVGILQTLTLANCGLLAQSHLGAWNAVVGLRNRIVHDYMNIDMTQVMAMVLDDKDKLIVDFLLKDFALTA
jgi:uncharacterized protein YutE (UPF0331/DUF86 family)